MKALILNNNVVDVVSTEFAVSPQMTWMDCPDDCKAGWSLIDGILTAPVSSEKTYAQKRKKEYEVILGEYLDGVVKDDQAQIDKYIEDCKAIKAKYPKPE
tara:strand:- start:27 stop:326 length:300 start_codon:yes stop_codon:yes gene_type:complete